MDQLSLRPVFQGHRLVLPKLPGQPRPNCQAQGQYKGFRVFENNGDADPGRLDSGLVFRLRGESIQVDRGYQADDWRLRVRIFTIAGSWLWLKNALPCGAYGRESR